MAHCVGHPIALAGCVLLVGAPAAAAPKVCAVAPAERGPGVTEAEAEGFYRAVVGRLAEAGGVRIAELKQLKLVLDQRDLALALSPSTAAQGYARSAAAARAPEVVLPGLSRLGADYLLSLRLIAVPDGATRVCSFAKTRLPSKFPVEAAKLVRELLGGRSAAAAGTEPSPAAKAEAERLRAECLEVGSERLFGSLWRRCEKLRAKGVSPALVDYYVSLLHLSARALSPPEGMVFVPGGHVSLKTSEGVRKLWVEPFYIDRCEVSVAEYAAFMAAAGREAKRSRPITAASATFNKPSLPVTGVVWSAADACARWRGRRLPTAVQWLRAAEGAKGGNLAGKADGHVLLAPAARPGGAAAACGAEGMGGNVREWTSTFYTKELYAKCPADAPREPAEGVLRLVVGRGWRTRAGEPIGTLSRTKPGEAFDDIGFRCALPLFGNIAGGA